MLEELRRAIRLQFEPRRHSALLKAIIAAFAVRPMIGDSGGASVLFGVVLVSLLLIALYNINVDEFVWICMVLGLLGDGRHPGLEVLTRQHFSKGHREVSLLGSPF